MSRTCLILLALTAQIAPRPWGLLVPLLAALTGAGRCGVLALALLAGVSVAGRSEGTDVNRNPDVSAVVLTGVWRAPAANAPFVATRDGNVTARWRAPGPPPTPGTPLTAWARVDSSGRALIVSAALRGPPRGAWADRWAAACRRRVTALLPPSRRGLVEALVLGQRENLDHVVRMACVDTGLMHLLALSGLHVSLVAAAVMRGLRTRSAVTLLLLCAFVALAGARPPLCRALLGWGIARAAQVRGRRVAPLSSLALVAVTLLAAEPTWADELSMQLSFLAVAGMIGLAGLLPPRLGILLAPAGAFGATAPLCVSVFGQVQPLGLVLTPLVMPLVAAVLLLGVALVLPGQIARPLEPVLGPALDTAIGLLDAMLVKLGELAPAPLRPRRPPGSGLWWSLGLVVALGAGRRRNVPTWLT